MKPVLPKEEMQHPTAFVADIQSIIDTGRRQSYAAVEQSAIATLGNIGRRIVEEEQNGRGRATYGTGLIKNLAEQLTPIYGTSYSKRNLDYYWTFYLLFPHEVIVNTRVHNRMRVTNHMLPHTSPICPPKKSCIAKSSSRNNSTWNNTIKNKPMATSIKAYDYLETLLGKTRSQKKLIKDPNRNYENTQHWNLDTEYLEPLKKFI